MKNECRHVESFEVFGEIRLRKCLDAEVRRREARHHALQPKRLAHAFRDLGARTVVAVERHRQILEELRAVGLHAGANLVEGLDRRTARVGWSLQHQWRDGADQHGFGNALRAEATDIASDFTAAGRMAHMNGVFQVQCIDERREIIGVRVQVIAVPGLARTAMAAAIMGDASIAARSEIEHLVFKGIRGERPAMTENDGLSFAPVVVIDLRAVSGCDRAHGLLH